MYAEAAPPPPPLAAADGGSALPPEKRLLEDKAGHGAIELMVRQHESGCQLAVVRLVAALCKTRDAKARAAPSRPASLARLSPPPLLHIALTGPNTSLTCPAHTCACRT